MTTTAPAHRGPMADPSLPPLTERNRTAATKYYDKNRALVAERRVYKRVQKSGKMPTQATMAKFDLKLNEKGELVGFSENLLRPKTVVYIPAIKPAVATLVQPIEKLPDGVISAKQAVHYIDMNYTKGKGYNSFYTMLGNNLKLFKSPIKTNIVPVFQNYDNVFNTMREHYLKVTPNKPNGSVTAYLKMINVILVVIQNYPPLKEALGETVIGKYISESKKTTELVSHATHVKLQTNRVYNWSKIMAAIKEDYGVDSIQFLFFSFYDEVPVRHELNNIPVLAEDGDDDSNWLVKNKKLWHLQMNKFKTDAGYVEGLGYDLSPALSAMITKSLKKHPRVNLFPENIYGLCYFAVQYAGAKYFPYGELVKPDTKQFVTGCRHTIATYRNRPGQTAKPRDVELASKMAHTIATSVSKYQNLHTPELNLLDGVALDEWRDFLMEDPYWISLEKEEKNIKY